MKINWFIHSESYPNSLLFEKNKISRDSDIFPVYVVPGMSETHVFWNWVENDVSYNGKWCIYDTDCVSCSLFDWRGIFVADILVSITTTNY